MAARLGVGLVGSRAQENVEASRALLEPLVADLSTELEALHPGSGATLTGTPIVRQASLDAVSRSLQTSVPIAVLLCLLVSWGFMRSLRYALASLAPILLVVAWLYGFMYVAGFSVNLVTATIGAISIGVGIDFATHMTMRYREELAVRASRMDALHAAAAGTGIALVGSAVSSAVGFAILAFAPMPMFASYGLLTAVMIGLALAASLLVLPGLLLLVSSEPDLPGAPLRPAKRLGRPRREIEPAT
jgi:predicted RND superfamily exporter protein